MNTKLAQCCYVLCLQCRQKAHHLMQYSTSWLTCILYCERLALQSFCKLQALRLSLEIVHQRCKAVVWTCSRAPRFAHILMIRSVGISIKHNTCLERRLIGEIPTEVRSFPEVVHLIQIGEQGVMQWAISEIVCITHDIYSLCVEAKRIWGQ